MSSKLFDGYMLFKIHSLHENHTGVLNHSQTKTG